MTEPPKCSRCADLTWHDGELQRQANRAVEAERQVAEARLSIAERVAEREALVERVGELEERAVDADAMSALCRDLDMTIACCMEAAGLSYGTTSGPELVARVRDFVAAPIVDKQARRRLEKERSAMRGEIASLSKLLARIVKYAREDKARTPGSTRLARGCEEARALLALRKKENDR